jgi:protein-tyrosine phosphatase
MDQRILDFTGIHNFRDYGGYATRDGRRVKPGLLFRSGQHKDATPGDLGKVAALKLKTIIDLRGDFERASFPCPRPDGHDAAVVFAPGETAGHAPHVEAAREVETAADAQAAMVALYRSMPFRPVLVATMRLYIDALATRDGPSLVHCLAGKDRTGLTVGLLHHLLGVARDDIMADYLLTNVAGNIDARIAAGAEVVRSNFGTAMAEDAVRTLMSVEAAYLDAAFAEIEARHGDIDAYCADILGVSSARRDALRERLLA